MESEHPPVIDDAWPGRLCGRIMRQNRSRLQIPFTGLRWINSNHFARDGHAAMQARRVVLRGSIYWAMYYFRINKYNGEHGYLSLYSPIFSLLLDAQRRMRVIDA